MSITNENSIVILGDSTSTTIGLERQAYPFLLAAAKNWPTNTRIINSSLPGFTSADGAAFFFRYQQIWSKSLRAVVVYLGNCDAASSEVRKGRYGRYRQMVLWARQRVGYTPAKTRIKNRLLHFEWNNAIDPAIESPENPSDFEFNIGRILDACQQMSVPVILIRPKANRYFPPGVGKGNFVFYRFLGFKEQISERIAIPDSRFRDAMRLQELGKFADAAESYKRILLTAPDVPMSQEYPMVVANNYAVAKAEAGEFAEAKQTLELLLKDRGARKEIVLYNLAQVERACGNETNYSRVLAESYESDESLYRIRLPYLEALDRLSSKYPFVRVVDMATVIPDNLYLDHCHPLPEGQARMAEAVSICLADIRIQGDSAAEIQNVLYNPELAQGNSSEFHEYFKTFSPLLDDQIEGAIKALARNLAVIGDVRSELPSHSMVPEEIRSAISYYLRHPCFPTVDDVLNFPPRYPSDVGRFPEYFIVRHLIPYLRVHEASPLCASRFDPGLGLLRTSGQLLSILPANSIALVASSPPPIDSAYEEVRLPLILAKVRRLLVEHLQAGNRVFERTKTTIFWYVREALRFGAHSRISMLYDRVLLEFLAEGLAVAGVLDAAMGRERSSEIEDLIRLLQGAVAIHDEYCGQFSLAKDSTQLLICYDRRLAELARILEAPLAE